LNAQEYVNHTFGFSINLSNKDGWEYPTVYDKEHGGLSEPVELALKSVNQKTGKQFILSVIKTDSLSTLSNAEQRRGLKEGMLETLPSPKKVVQEKMDNIAGVPSYEFTAIVGTNINAGSMRVIFIIKDNNYFNFSLLSTETNNLPDQDLSVPLSSFHFIDKNQVIDLKQNDKGTAYNIGFKVGQISVLIIILVIIYFVMTRIRKRRKAA
jgi:hypothetical protein